MSDDDDVRSPIDLRDPVQARAWVADTIARRPARPHFFDAFAAALAQLGSAEPLAVLELGSGPGHLARELLRARAIRRYVALDFSAAMHDLAREHLGELAARVELVLRDFRAADWTEQLGRFDAILTMQAAHETRHRRHLAPLLARARSLLNSNGALLYCDHYAEAGTAKNPALYADRDGQIAALHAAGFARVERLHDEGGMALYRAYATVPIDEQ